jgi:hypothetical protein
MRLQSALSSWLRACSVDLALAPVPSRSLPGTRTPQKAAYDAVYDKLGPVLARLTALSLKRGGSASDPVTFLAIRHEPSGLAIVFEPDRAFGAYLRFCQSKKSHPGVIVSLHSPMLGENATLDKILNRKDRVRTQEVVNSMDALQTAIKSLPRGKPRALRSIFFF